MSTTHKRSEQEARRLIGGEMLLKGCDVDDVIQATQVQPFTVYRWKKIIDTKGIEGLLRQGQSGRSAKLDSQQLELLKETLRKGAVVYGFSNEQWTSKRVAQVIFEQFQVEYNTHYACEILKSLNLSPQLPQVHSVKRDQAAINRWKRYVWPVIKKIAD